MDLTHRLSSIEQEIQQVENRKLDLEQRLALFWEHMPPLDPNVILGHMRSLREQIIALEERKRGLLEEQQALIVQAVILGGPGE